MSGIRDLVGSNPPVRQPRTEAEDAVRAAMPGDDISDHPLGATNPYLGRSYTELKKLGASPDLPAEDRRQVMAALREMDQHHLHPHTSRVR